MSASLRIDVTSAESSIDVPWAARVRVRPARGRALELCLASNASERVSVEAGEVAVHVVLSSGSVADHVFSLAEGEERTLAVTLPASPHEAMRWLSLAREPQKPVTPPVGPGKLPISFIVPPHEGFGILPERPAVKLLGRAGTPGVQIRSDTTYEEGRVLQIADERDVSVFAGEQGSALTLLAIEQPARSSGVRIAALPGPRGASNAPKEVHVALRHLAGDVLPHLQIVPADEYLATVVGFLERGDQSALSLLREPFVNRSVDFMRGKRGSPLAAAIGLALLIRLGELEQVEGWSRNLWRWFPALPDGGALHAAVMLRAPEETPSWQQEYRAAVLGAAHAGMPLLSDSLRHLRDALVVLRNLDGGEQDAEVRAATRWCDRLLRAMDPAAVFTTITLNAKDLDLVWGQRKGNAV